ncbi:small lysine-rich protein 1 [Adelges cooleyi]|uniref:small lysine-rich protein 1 n=1 Tax=Adelges cooleyi TaxID=133065 RepID=UPI00217F7220|nr:small lysine-rich protein 1 [Adelges cooleyi]
MSKQGSDKKSDVKTSNAKDEKKPKKPAVTATVKTRKEGKKSRNLVDVFNECAMDNAYHTCHNVQDLLRCRGFPWPQTQKKKKKKKGGKKGK